MHPDVRQFLTQVDEASTTWGLAQFLSVKICWCEAADAVAPQVDLAIPIFDVDDGVAVLSWVYPGERLTVEVNHRGWVTWEVQTLTGVRAAWACLTTGAGIPEARIRGIVRRRAKAFGAVL